MINELIKQLSELPNVTLSDGQEYIQLYDAMETVKRALEQESYEDAISRILNRMWNCRGKHTTSIDKVKMEQIIRDELPSVKPQPCDDAISRQAAIDCLTATGLKKFDFILDARDKIKNLPPVKPQEPKWIPVSERLPKEGEDVLACFYTGEGNYKMMVSRRSDYNYWSGVGRTADMVAWMPLPEPYEP